MYDVSYLLDAIQGWQSEHADDPTKGLEELLEILKREDVYGRDIAQMKNAEFLKHFQKYAEASGTPGVCDSRQAWFTRDVSVEDLRAGERSPLRPLFDAIATEWCGSDHSRVQHPRCGTVYAYNSPVDGNGRVEIALRFPFREVKQPDPDGEDKYKRVGEALGQPLEDAFDAHVEEYAAKQKLMASSSLKISEVEILLHALGHPTYYRNYFAADPGSWDWSCIQVLIHTGFVEEYKSRDHDSGMQYFHVTEKGKQRMRDAGFAVPWMCRKKGE